MAIFKGLKLAVVGALMVAAIAAAGAAPPVALPDVNGHMHRPLETGRTTVIIFIADDCPRVNTYSPEINRMCKAYARRGVIFYLIEVNPGTTPAAARKHAVAYGYRCPVLLDGKHRLARFCGAKVTPECAVIGPDGKILYHGAIDDLYYSIVGSRESATRHYLRDALDDVLAGRPVRTPATESFGCSI